MTGKVVHHVTSATTSPTLPNILGGLFIMLIFEKHIEKCCQQIVIFKNHGSVQFSSVAQSCPTLQPHELQGGQASLSITNSWSSPKLMCIESVMPSSHLILCHPLLLLPPIPPYTITKVLGTQNSRNKQKPITM